MRSQERDCGGKALEVSAPNETVFCFLNTRPCIFILHCGLHRGQLALFLVLCIFQPLRVPQREMLRSPELFQPLEITRGCEFPKSAQDTGVQILGFL